MRILAVEDSDTDFILIQHALGDEYELRRSTTLRDGLKLAAEQVFDLVILDLTVEDSSGLATFERMHAAFPDIPVLILSGSEDEELTLRTLGGGAQDYIPKSHLLYYLLNRAVRYAIERHRTAVALRESQKLAGDQQRLRESIAGLEQVLRVVGHELRTPLAALRAISEFLTSDGARATAEADQFLHEISRQVCRMSDTVNNILEAARLNSGRARWIWSEIDLDLMIGLAIKSVQPLIDAEAVTLVNRVDHRCGMILGDCDAIQRLLSNLLSNAIKHTKQGQIQVSANRCTDAEGQWIELSVTDSGCGIAPELITLLGEAFALNSSVVGANHIDGAGLGLAICKGIAAAHGGKLSIQSRVGTGTTVIARLRGDLNAAIDGDTVQEAMVQNLAA